jgi:hypothetical protein
MPVTPAPKPDATAAPHTASSPIQSISPAQSDWVVVLLPTALGISTFSVKASLLALGLLCFVTFVRKAGSPRSIQAGPFVLLIASAVIVFARSDHQAQLTFILLALLVIRLVFTVDPRVLIAALIDGAGVYLALNVLTYFAGLRSPWAGDRFAYTESSGFVRTIFPLSGSLDVGPTIASVYVAAVAFLIFEQGWIRRSFRLACCVAAFVVLTQGGDRTSLFAAIVLPVIVFCVPFITRWLAQAVTLFASVSALFLPSIITSVEFVAAPLVSFTSGGRVMRSVEVTSLNGRDYIWRKSIDYWMNNIIGIQNRLLGFGQDGQYRSGASLTYAEKMVGTVRHPELASVHNAFLQQLFDGGLAGWLLLTLAILWASVRLARRRREWGSQGLAAIVAIVALLVNAMTQVSIAPGYAQPGFWMLVILVGVSCQAPSREHAQTGTSAQQPNFGQLRPSEEESGLNRLHSGRGGRTRK